jgi:polar amino acid transport system substrate-binding protein
MIKGKYLRPRFRSYSLWVIFLASLLLIARCRKDGLPLNDDPERFRYLTETYPPFNYSENGQLNGVSVDILDALFGNLNLSVDRQAIELSDWGSSYEMVLDSPGTMLFSTVKTVERTPLFKWVGPIAPHTDVAITLKSTGYALKEVADLNNYFTGVIDGYSSINTLMKHGVQRTNIVIYNDIEELYKALVVNREVQFISYSEWGHNLVIQALGYPAADFAPNFKIHSDELYYAFNIETTDRVITGFQQKLDELKSQKSTDGSSEYEKILNRYSLIHQAADGLTAEMVINLVNRTAEDLATDAPGTIAKINQGLAPYKDPANPALYSFAYNTDVVMVAHATNLSLVGVSFAGKPDVAGKNFRDDIVSGALENGTGWVDYTYTKPDQSGLYYKTTYYKLVTGSNSTQYIVCAGKFK